MEQKLEVFPDIPHQAGVVLPRRVLTNVLPVHVVVEGDTVILGSDVVEGADEPGFVSRHPGPGSLNEHVITYRTRGKGGERQCALRLPPCKPRDARGGEIITAPLRDMALLSPSALQPTAIPARDTCGMPAAPPLPR